MVNVFSVPKYNHNILGYQPCDKTPVRKQWYGGLIGIFKQYNIRTIFVMSLEPTHRDHWHIWGNDYLYNFLSDDYKSVAWNMKLKLLWLYDVLFQFPQLKLDKIDMSLWTQVECHVGSSVVIPSWRLYHCTQISYRHDEVMMYKRFLHYRPFVSGPDSKVHGGNLGPIWGRQDPCGPHVGPMNFAIWVDIWNHCKGFRAREIIGSLPFL